MNGFRIFSQAQFGELFADVFPTLLGYHWLTLSEAFKFSYECLDQSDYDCETDKYTSGPMADFEKYVTHIGTNSARGSTSYGFSAANDIFPKYASIVSDDWNSIFGISRPVPDPETWLKNYYAERQRAQYLETHCEAIFLNVDGAFWEYFTRSQVRLNEYEQHLLQRGIAYEARQLSQCEYL